MEQCFSYLKMFFPLYFFKWCSLYLGGGGGHRFCLKPFLVVAQYFREFYANIKQISSFFWEQRRVEKVWNRVSTHNKTWRKYLYTTSRLRIDDKNVTSD